MKKLINKSIRWRFLSASVWLLCLFQAFSTNAQVVQPIDLETVMELSGANNLSIQEYKQRQEMALADLAKAKEWWLPEVYAGLQTHQLWGAAMNGNGNFFLDVSRNSLWAGLGLKAHWDFSKGIYTSRAAKLKIQASVYATEAEKNKAILAGINAYYGLMAAQLKWLAYQNLAAQADSISQQIAVQVDAGLRYQSELLLSKSNHSHLRVEMLNAKMEYNRRSAELVRLLKLEGQTKLVSVDSVLLPLDFEAGLETVSDTAYKNRAEVKAIDFTRKSLEEKRKMTTRGLLFPQISMNTNGSYFGRINGQITPMEPIANPNPKQLYPTGIFNVSLMWEIPLGRIFYKGDLEQYNSQIKFQEIKSEQFRVQINEEISVAYSQLQIGTEQIQIAKEALEISGEALSQSIEREKLGTVKAFEVFQAQQFYLQAQIDFLEAVSEYNKAQFALKVAKGESP